MSKEPVLVIMAAGMGSRYGGLKQMDPIGLSGEVILDFSVYDAIQAGFQKVIFIIKKEMESDFRDMISRGAGRHIEAAYVFQDINDLPPGYSVPADRVKPWGTAHATLCAAPAIDGPFAVLNADDFYGRAAFQKIYQFLSEGEARRLAMIGYQIENTLSESGYVSRGICEANPSGLLTRVIERVHIEKRGSEAAYTEDGGQSWIPVPAGTPVSMNFWGFTAEVLDEIKKRFAPFLDKTLKENPQKGEFYLPLLVDELLREGSYTVRILKSPDKWYGVTNREDKASVAQSIQAMQKEGIYPAKLWD